MDKGNNGGIGTLLHDDKIITDSQEIADTMNDFFENAVNDLHIK